MKEHLLKRALPFTLTFIIGAAAGGFSQLFAARGGGWLKDRGTYGYYGRRGCGKKFRRHHRAFDHAPERTPVSILHKPVARHPSADEWGRLSSGFEPVRVRVTFGDDGRVRAAAGLAGAPDINKAAERAAWGIRFLPATFGGAPTTVTEEVEVLVAFD